MLAERLGCHFTPSRKRPALAAFKALRARLFDPTLRDHCGRIVKVMGDGMLAAFPSVVDAVEAAVETQQALAEYNASLPEMKRSRGRLPSRVPRSSTR